MSGNNTSGDAVIELLFGVKGGGLVDGESGKLIVKQLQNIAKDIKIEIPVVAEDSALKELQAKLKEISKPVTVPIKTETTEGNGGSNSVKKHTEAYNELKAAIDKYGQSLVKQASQVGTSGKAFESAKLKLKEYEAALNSTDSNGLLDGEKKELQEVYVQWQKLAEVERTAAESAQLGQLNGSKLTSFQGLKANIASLIERYSELKTKSKEAAAAIAELETLQKEEYLGYSKRGTTADKLQAVNVQYTDMAQKIKALSAQLSDAAAKSDTLGNKLKDALSHKVLQQFAYVVYATVVRAIKQIYDNVVELDSAMTQLKIVTKATTEEMDDFADSISATAKKIGASIADLTESVTTFARLGFSLSDSTQYATLIAEYAAVADTTVSEATTNLTAAIKAWGIEGDELEEALDKLIKVGNNFAVSSEELGTALNNAASSLAATGNSYEQALGIFAAANATVQDIDKASTAVRTIAARISASTTELEELGETTDDVLATADLAKEMAAYGVAITDTNGELLSTYEILDQLAEKWDEYTSTEQAAIAGMVAGTRQQNWTLS